MSKRPLEPPVIGIAAVYFFCFTLALWPITDFFTTALPLQLGRVEWRYASVGLMTVYLTTPILGVGVAMIVAFLLQHRLVLRILSVLSLLGAVFLIVAMLILGLDVIQLRGIVTPEGMPSLQVGGIIAGAKLLGGFVTVLLLGVAGWQSSSRSSQGLSRKETGSGATWLGSKTRDTASEEA